MVFKTHVWARGMCPKSSCRLRNRFYPVIGISPCCRTNVQNSVRKLCHVPVWYRIRFSVLLCDVQAAFGAFHCIEKQPALAECQTD